MSDDPTKPPRFPYIAALLCVACLGAAVWMWMRYSWCWMLAPDDIASAQPAALDDNTRFPLWGYVQVQGEAVSYGVHPEIRGWSGVVRAGKDDSTLLYAWDTGPPPGDGRVAFTGRLITMRMGGEDYLGIDGLASRLAGASIAGLVVGAMGLFVFTVALRHWLKERRKFREEARAYIGYAPQAAGAMTDDPAKPPCFPYVGALICAACVGVAGWLWLRHSYAWDVGSQELLSRGGSLEGYSPPPTQYFRLRDTIVGYGTQRPDPGSELERDCVHLVDTNGTLSTVPVVLPFDRRASPGTQAILSGRLVVTDCIVTIAPEAIFSRGDSPGDWKTIWVWALDCSRSRFTGASIVGLVVGAIGVFVFTVALRRWLKERRAFREEAAGA